MIFLGKFEITNSKTGEYLSVEASDLIVTNSNSESNSIWNWTPKQGSDIWGYIHQSESGLYLTLVTDSCEKWPKKGTGTGTGKCSVKMQKLVDGKNNQEWRRQNNKIISKYVTNNNMGKIPSLTLSADGKVVTKPINNDEDDDWILSDIGIVLKTIV